MQAEINGILTREAIDTLEKLAFVFGYPEDVAAIATDDLCRAGVEFRGPFEGRLVMGVSWDALPELTANMLGLDESEPLGKTEQQDAMKETLNIICGNILPVIAGTEAVFDLGAPAVIDDTDLPAAADANLVASAGISLDEGGCTLHFYVKGGAAQLRRQQG